MGEILVTGANGFIGSHICQALIEAGFAVRALVRESSDLSNIKDLPLNIVYGDLNDPLSLEKAVSGADSVISNAGLTKALDPAMFRRVNVEGTINLLEAVAKSNPGVKRFVQISSAAASGSSDSIEPVREDSIPRPLTAYGRSKLEAEGAVLSYEDKFPVVILRPSAVYGPRDREMLAFFKIIKLGVKPTFGPGECYCSFTYVKDIAAAVVRTLSAEPASGSVYFVAEKRYYSYSEAGDIISRALGRPAIDIHIPLAIVRVAGRISEFMSKVRRKASIFTYDKAVEISQKFWIQDSSKISEEIGFVCPTSFEAGVKETVDWYRREDWL